MLVAGIMSGTSADAIDVALVRITGRGWKTRHQMVAFHSAKYPDAVRQRVLAIAGGQAVPAGEISQLNFLLGELFAKACAAACKHVGVPLRRIQLIGSHGQTIFHQGQPSPFCGVPVRSTLQIGELAIIANRTGVTTIGDFRPADIAAGGQGAPLVPFFDYLMYRDPRRGRIALNIGGIANLTAIPAGGGPGEVIAFDTGPGNMLIDALAVRATDGRQPYDAGGRLASNGTVSTRLIAGWMKQRYFRTPPPKSAGREQFGAAYLKRYFHDEFSSSRRGRDKGKQHGMQDALATATAFTAESIARGIADFVIPKFPVHDLIVTGGGVKNRFLMSQLRERIASLTGLAGRAGIRIVPSGSAGIPSSAKEAIAFAVLAYHSYHGLPANLPSATGARHPAVLGKVAYAGR